MKMNNIYKIFFFTVVLLSITACELEEVNINPNNPKEVPANVILPFNEEGLARLMAGTGQVMSGVFMQYYQGIDNHPIQVQIYVVSEALYVDWDWNDYYDGPMINLRKMIEIAEKENAYYYSGIGKVLMAHCVGNVTSLWGDVPYSEALLGSLNRSPKYDPQQSIYESIQLLLDDGIADLQQTYNGLKPGADDIIFNGDKTKWLKTAYALKARYYMHLTKRSADLSFNPAEKALEAVANAMTSSSDDLEFHYGFTAAEYNPFYSYSLLKYVIPNLSFTSMLSALNDPRKDFYYKKRFGVADFKDCYFTSSNSPVLMMTYHELMFIEAEARLRLNENDPAAQIALQKGVSASINKVSKGTLDPTIVTTYKNTNAVLTGTFENKLSTLITQKYIAMFASIESWTDYRRTGYPVLVPNAGGDHNQNPGGAIPRRLTYPQKERLYNLNFPSYLPNLQDRFWWDQ
ncbi:MAG: SusD/RagB family nutrient-binding outer membrane lipoprotein [Tenuifilaceae bacterium]